MFRKLIYRLSRKHHDNKHQLDNDDSLKILRNFKHNNSRLTIEVESYQQTFQSSVITIDRSNNTLIMDELFPKPEFKIKENTLLHCKFHENGSLTSFRSPFIKHTRSDGMPAILVRYPSNVKHGQRRSNFRLTLKSSHTSSAKLFPSYRPTLTGVIKDISSHGLRINIQGNESDTLKKGDILKSCQIFLDKNRSIECQLTVRSKRYYNRPYRHTQIGTEITDIQLSDRKRLSRYINQQQRIQCRLKVTDRL
jgi:c-di-GMP-binding flagellar brake protein YcgR